MTVATAPRIAAFLNLGENELFQEALASLLRDKKRQVLRARLDILGRYRVQSIGELEAMIANGKVDEPPSLGRLDRGRESGRAPGGVGCPPRHSMRRSEPLP